MAFYRKIPDFGYCAGIQDILSLNVLEKVMKIIFLFTTLTLCGLLPAQMPDWEQDFVYEKSTSDTIYLAEDEFVEGSYLVFHSKDELYQHFADVNFDKTGEITNEYQYTIEEIPGRYVAKNDLVNESYRDFCKTENKTFPDDFRLDDLKDLDETENDKFLKYLKQNWEIPVSFYEGNWREPFLFELIITETDWRKKEFLDMMNELMKKGFLNKAPLNFTFDGIEVIESETILWNDLQRIELDRETNELIVKTNSGKEIKFSYPENQYSCLADFHVNFLAFYKRMLN
ncbi:MAG: hypothetical protein WCY25_00610 [Moheibacter sp.]